MQSRDVLCQVLWTCGAKGIADRQVPVIGEPDDDVVMGGESAGKPLAQRERQRLEQLEAAERQRQRSKQSQAQGSRGQQAAGAQGKGANDFAGGKPFRPRKRKNKGAKGGKGGKY